MTHQQFARHARPLFYGALSLCGALVGAASGCLAWRLTRPHG